MQYKKIIVAGLVFLLVAVMSGMQPASAAIASDQYYFTTNYTVGGTYAGNYSKGGETVTFTCNITDAGDDAGVIGTGSNVSVLIYNTTVGSLHTTVYLSNQTVSGNGTWNGTWTAVSSSWTSNANITFNISDSSDSAQYTIDNFFVDADDPSGGTPSEVTQTWDTRTGNSKNITVTITDNVAVSYATFDYTSVPSGSAKTDTTMTCNASAEHVLCNYTFTPDVVGSYTYRVVTYDNVTNSHTGTSYTITFKLRADELPPRMIQRKTVSGTPTPTAQPSSSDPFSVIGDVAVGISNIGSGIINTIMDFFQGIYSSIFG